MAYRFLLEVPDTLYNEANVVISSTPDAGIVDVHEGIGGDFDKEGKTLTISAHTLSLPWALKSWYGEVQASDPAAAPVNYLLTNGTRIAVGESEPTDVVAVIRRDQPWVERSIPRIGDHATRTGPAEALVPAVAKDDARATTAVVNALRVADVTILATDEPTDHPVITIDGTPMLHLQVVDLIRPERAYAEIFGTTLVDRADRDRNGEFVWHGASQGDELRFGEEPAFSFVQNGPLTIALDRQGRSYLLDVFANPPAPIRLLVSDDSYETIKAEALVRNWNVFDDTTPGVFGFRDPFGYTWAIHSESFEKGPETDA